ncbi:SRPBCC family protein [Streptomyces sp. NPDC001928]|uniref:SRPBCC family protein n=1 Tax=Streptomyces sp. NPDC001928 TaxID=3154404 RepID=UPI003332914C
MTVLNVHERALPASRKAVGALIDGLGAEDDRLWPPGWPPVRFDGPLAVGAYGGHGPVRYVVSHYVPGHWVRLRFTGPRGFDGFHEFSVEPLGEELTVLRNILVLRPRGVRWLGWLLFLRPLHDAAFRHSLDCAEHALTGRVACPVKWGWYVGLLRAATARLAPRRADRSGSGVAGPGP